MTARTFLFAILALLGTLSQVVAGDLVAEIRDQSRYYGVGWQNDGNHWSIELLIQGQGAQIAYPSIGCAGKWTLQGTYSAELNYTEQILDGTEDCINLGSVRLEPLPDGRLLYVWMERAPTVDAKAVLVPLAGKRMSYMELLKLTIDTVSFDYVLPEFRQ
ncbi:MAG: hypothetical protein ACE5DK_03885 [Paracoccaceae bacterium]